MTIHKQLAAFALIAITSACSGGDKIVSPDTLNNNNSGPKKLSTADSLYVVEQMSGSAFASIKALRNITAPPVPGLFASAAPSPCNPTVTGTTDSNGNGIPDDKLTTFTAANCTYTLNGIVTAVTGSIRQQDLNGNYGYRITYSNYNAIGRKGDSTFTSSVDGTLEYAFTTTTSARTLDALSISASVAASTGSYTLSRVANLAGTFTPTGGNILSRTAALPSGTLTIGGTLNIVGSVTGNMISAGNPTSQTISILLSTTTQLNANIGCSLDASINSGALQATVGGSQTGSADVTFRVCGQGGTPTANPPGGGKK